MNCWCIYEMVNAGCISHTTFNKINNQLSGETQWLKYVALLLATLPRARQRADSGYSAAQEVALAHSAVEA